MENEKNADVKIMKRPAAWDDIHKPLTRTLAKIFCGIMMSYFDFNFFH